jgi:hypothetical protein
VSILALDIGATVGWARSDGRSGSASFVQTDHGWSLAMFSDWIEEQLAEPTAKLVIERPFGSAAFRHRLTLLMEGVAHMHAAARNIPRTDRTANEVRKWLLGFSVLPKQPGESKAERTREMDKLVLAAVRARGFNPLDEHAADACALLCAVECRMPRESEREAA